MSKFMGAVQPGEALVTLNGGGSGVVVWVRGTPGQADRYNLTVAHDHTYAVGAGQWVVHNCSQTASIGYHATFQEKTGPIMKNGLRPSTQGRMGPGVYVSDTPEGAAAEFSARNPTIEPAIIEVGYTPGRVGDLRPLQDSGVTISVRPGGTVNTVIRNGSAIPIRIMPAGG